jgi:hypothetical protein
MAIDIPSPLRNEDFAACLVRRYLAPDPQTGRARYSGAYFERIGGGGDRLEVAFQFTAEDLLAVTMLSVQVDGYHALHVLDYDARELSGLLAQIPVDVSLGDPAAESLIAPDGPAWALWTAVCETKPRNRDNKVGPVAAGKLLARKRPHLIPVYDSRVESVLNRTHIHGTWWHDLRGQLIDDSSLVPLLTRVRERAGAGHMSLLRVFDVMCWMFSWAGEVSACGGEE